MDTPSIKDYIDARDEAIIAITKAQQADIKALYSMVEARMSEMETRVTQKMTETVKWCVGAMIAGMTLTLSISTYMQVATLNRVESLAVEVRTLQTNVTALQVAVNSLKPNNR